MQKENMIGLKIAYYRKLNELTQEELAKSVGVFVLFLFSLISS